MKVTLCDRCNTQTKSPHEMDGFDLCVDCWALWQDKYKDFKERFMTKPNKGILSGMFPSLNSRVLLMGMGGLFIIMLLLVVFRII